MTTSNKREWQVKRIARELRQRVATKNQVQQCHYKNWIIIYLLKHEAWHVGNFF